MDHATAHSQTLERARLAVCGAFLANGGMIGGWAVVIPSVEAKLAVGHATFGLALLFMAAGAILAMPIAGGLVARFGSRVVLVVSALCLFPTALGPVLAPNLAALAAALFLFGAANGAMDVAMNAHGVAVENRLGRPVMSFFHGLYSVGGLIGAVAGALFLVSQGPLAFNAVLAAVLLVVFIVSSRGLLHGSVDTQDGGATFAWPTRPVMGLAILSFLALMSEGAIVDWCGIYLRTVLGAGPSLSATGFAVFAGTMAIARLTGDRLRARFGTEPLVIVSGTIAAFGVAMTIATSNPIVALVGLGFSGLGIANLIPVIFGAAGRMQGLSAGSGIAAVTTLGYTGFLVGPPLIGQVAQFAGLDRALAIVAVALAICALGARATRAR
jgi:MFS family permease